MEQQFIVEVNNIPEETEDWVVARCVARELWYWGSYERESQAKEVAKLIDGVVVRKVGNGNEVSN